MHCMTQFASVVSRFFTQARSICNPTVISLYFHTPHHWCSCKSLCYKFINMSKSTTDYKEDIVSSLSKLTIDHHGVDKLLQEECYMKWFYEIIPNFCETEKRQKILGWISLVERKADPLKGQQCSSPIHVDKDFYQNGMEHIVHLGALQYFYQTIDKFDESKYYFDEVQKYISQCVEQDFIPLEYQNSFNYVFGSLSLFTSARESEQNTTTFFTDVKYSRNDFSNLSSKGQAAVFGMKQFFFGILTQTDLQPQIELLRKAIELDPDYHEYPFCLQTLLRYKRRKGHYHHNQNQNGPSEEEKDAMLTANRLSPNNSRCMVGEIFLLVDILKVQISNGSKWTPITYGDHKFLQIDNLVAFVKKQTKKILETSPISVRINSTICEIFTVLLPHQYRDFRLGESYLKRCLKYYPSSSKAQHRLAVLYLTQKKFDLATRLLEKVVESPDEERNFSSLACLIQVLLRNPVKYKNNLMDVFTKELESSWNDQQISQLLFFHALFFLYVGQITDAIDAFIKSFERDSDTSKHFIDLPYQRRRYGWENISEYSFGFIGDVLEDCTKQESDLQRKEILNILLKNVGTAIRKERDYQRSRRR